jgi:hypothetical protein
MGETNWLKPSVSVSRIGDSARAQAVTRVNAGQASKRTMRRPTRQPFRMSVEVIHDLIGLPRHVRASPEPDWSGRFVDVC